MSDEKLSMLENQEDREMNKKNFITHLKYLRKRSALTLENLSQMTGISVSYLSRLESGARRLNTDLIKRLSQALDCDPAELLQDTIHDEASLITTAEIRKIRTLNFAREKSKKEVKGDLKFDLPVYELSFDAKNGCTLNLDQKSGFRNRPYELSDEKDAICIVANKSMDSYFPEGASVFLVNKKSYVPETTVLIVKNSNEVLLKKIWSVTPNGIQCCDIDKLAKLKCTDYASSSIDGNNVISIENYASYLMDVKLSDVKAIYQIVGYML